MSQLISQHLIKTARLITNNTLRNMASNASSYNIIHDKEKSMFYIDLEKGNALLEYTLQKDVMDIYHTEVPVAYRGKSIAKYLVKDALSYAIENVLKIRPTCTYVLKYVTDNPDPLITVVK